MLRQHLRSRKRLNSFDGQPNHNHSLLPITHVARRFLLPPSAFRLGIEPPDQGPSGGGVSRGLGGRRGVELRPIAVGPLLPDAEGRSRPTAGRPVAGRGRAPAVRPARRSGSGLPGPLGPLRPTRQLPVGRRGHRAARHGGAGIGAAATAGEAGPRRAVRRGPQATAAAAGSTHRGGDQPDGGGHPRLSPGARPPVARGRRVDCAGPRAGRGGGRRNRRRH